jgi:hypothetical protein
MARWIGRGAAFLTGVLAIAGVHCRPDEPREGAIASSALPLVFPAGGQELVAPNDGQPMGGFGNAVALGETAVAIQGAPVARFFVRAGATITANAAKPSENNSEYGTTHTVAIAGADFVLGISSDLGLGNQTFAGSVKVFGAVPAYIKPSPGMANGRFGLDIAASGSTFVATYPGEGDSRVYALVNGSWSSQGTLPGKSYVAIDGDTAASFGPVVTISVRSNGAWTTQATIATPATATAAIALSGDTLVVGLGGQQHGARVYVRSGGSWGPPQDLVASDVVDADNYGTSVAVRGDVAIVGAPYQGRNEAGTRAEGAAYVFVRTGSAWGAPTKLVLPPGTLGAFGTSVAVTSDAILVGAPGRAPSGAAYFFDNPTWAPDAGAPVDAAADAPIDDAGADAIADDASAPDAPDDAAAAVDASFADASDAAAPHPAGDPAVTFGAPPDNHGCAVVPGRLDPGRGCVVAALVAALLARRRRPRAPPT